MENLLVELKTVLSTSPQRWNNLCQTISEDLLRRQPLPNEWSALECLQHLIEVEELAFAPRIKILLAGEDFPAIKASTDYATQIKDVKPSDLAAKFASIRAESLKILEDVSPADLERTARHVKFGEISMGELLHEWGGHDLMHLVQAEQAIMQPFIAGSGALDIFFEKHIARVEA